MKKGNSISNDKQTRTIVYTTKEHIIEKINHIEDQHAVTGKKVKLVCSTTVPIKLMKLPNVTDDSDVYIIKPTLSANSRRSTSAASFITVPIPRDSRKSKNHGKSDTEVEISDSMANKTKSDKKKCPGTVSKCKQNGYVIMTYKKDAEKKEDGRSSVGKRIHCIRNTCLTRDTSSSTDSSSKSMESLTHEISKSGVHSPAKIRSGSNGLPVTSVRIEKNKEAYRQNTAMGFENGSSAKQDEKDATQKTMSIIVPSEREVNQLVDLKTGYVTPQKRMGGSRHKPIEDVARNLESVDENCASGMTLINCTNNEEQVMTERESRKEKATKVSELITENGAGITTISTDDLGKLLRQYNLTLKAVPFDCKEGEAETWRSVSLGKEVKLIQNNRKGGQVYITSMMNTSKEYKPTVGANDSTKMNILGEPGRNTALSFQTDEKNGDKKGSKRPLRVQVRLRDEDKAPSGITVSKTTPQGTFSNWRIDCKKSYAFCTNPETRSRSKRTRENGKNGRAGTQSAGKKAMLSKILSNIKRPEDVDVALSNKSFQSFNENNNTRVQDVVHFQPRMTPLSRAFLDLEERDQAARETVRSLENIQHINSNPTMADARTGDLCPLSPTMRELVQDNLVDVDAGDAFQSDPVLTSAVVFPCQNAESDYAVGDLELSYLPLPSTRAKTPEANVFVLNDGNEMLNQNHVKSSANQSTTRHPEKNIEEQEEELATTRKSDPFRILDNCYSRKNQSELSHEYYGFPSNPAEDSLCPKISLPSVKQFQTQTNASNIICQSPANNYFCSQDGNRETKNQTPSLHHKHDSETTIYSGDFKICHCSKGEIRGDQVTVHQYGTYCTSISHGTKIPHCLQVVHRDCDTKRRCASPASDNCFCKQVIESDAVQKQRIHDANKKKIPEPQSEQRTSGTDSFKLTSPRNWNSEQVTAWFRDTAEKYHEEKRMSLRSKNDVSKTKRKRKLTTVNSYHPEYDQLVPSTVNSLSGQTLCQFTVDDLVDIGLNREFALYATEVVHRFSKDENCEEIIPTDIDNNMSNHNSYDISSSLQSIPITSAEQLEESVNFDDLLGSDNLIGSLELSDVFETSTSFLKSLGQDYTVTRTSIPSPRTPPVSMQFHQPIPEFSYASIHRQIQQNGLTNCRESGIMSTINLYRNDVNSSHPYKRPYQYNPGYEYRVKQEDDGTDSSQNFFENYQSDQVRVKCETPDHTFQYLQISSNPIHRTISPSTFYNMPDTPSASLHNYHPSVSEQNFSNTLNEPKWEGVCSTPTSSRISVHRDSSMSDTDSGIYSPESTPNKNHCGIVTPSFHTNYCGIIEGKNPRILVQEQDRYTPLCSISEEQAIQQSQCDRGAWPNVMCADMQAEQSYISQQDNNNEVFAFAESGSKSIQCCEQKSDEKQMDELWERESTSSTISTLSVESEPKLLNMDDYKTYIATKPLNDDMTQQTSQSYHCNIQQSDDQIGHVSPTMRTLTGNVVFVPSKGNPNDCVPIPSTKPIVESKQKRTKVVTSGQITTVYPAFMANIRRTNSLPNSQGDKSKPKGNAAAAKNKPFSAHGSPSNHEVSPSKQLAIKSEFLPNGGSEPLYDNPFEGKIRRPPAGKSIHLWEFIRDTLLNPLYCPRLIKWEDRHSGIFRFVQSDVVAAMWGEKKNNPKMTYEKLSRAMRYYYNRGILERVDGRRLVYKFGRNAHGWQLSTADKHTDIKTSENLKKETSTVITNRRLSTLQTTRVKSSKMSINSPKRSSKYQISVSLSRGGEQKFLPPRKRRRLSEPEVHNGIPLVSNDQKSAGTQTSPSPSIKDANKVNEKTAEEPIALGSEPDTRQSSSSDDVTECVVFVASTDPITTTKPKQYDSCDKSEHAVESEECWSPGSSPDHKLPSADVLLGKHYKIATVAI